MDGEVKKFGLTAGEYLDLFRLAREEEEARRICGGCMDGMPLASFARPSIRESLPATREEIARGIIDALTARDKKREKM